MKPHKLLIHLLIFAAITYSILASPIATDNKIYSTGEEQNQMVSKKTELEYRQVIIDGVCWIQVWDGDRLIQEFKCIEQGRLRQLASHNKH